MTRVSIGLPVYNGERFISEALESLLAQTFEDFEIIISDNASVDGTEGICRDFAARDARVKYHRKTTNEGAACNFNRTFELATGEYFKWAAHDDICEPELLARCVEVLDRDPGVVLCYSKTRIIDAEGKSRGDYNFRIKGHLSRPQDRFRSQIRSHQCYEIFGLLRYAALKTTGLIGNYAGGDAVLLLRLCLMGRFHEIPDTLFFPRSHVEQSMAIRKNIRAFSIWFDPRNRERVIFPYWRIFAEYLKTVRAARKSGELSLFGGAFCRAMIAGWAIRRARRLAVDLVTAGRHQFQRPASSCVPRAPDVSGVNDRASSGRRPAG